MGMKGEAGETYARGRRISALAEVNGMSTGSSFLSL